MKTLFFVMGLLALMTGCKRKTIAPESKPTEINLLVVDEVRTPLPNIKVLIGGSTGSYFGGTRHDTTFAYRYTETNGLMVYKAIIDSKWRVYTKPVSFFDDSGNLLYDIARFEGTVDGIVNVGVVNNITVVMRKR